MTIAEDIQSVAASWVTRLDAAGPDPALDAELEEWLARDIRHEGAFMRAKAAWLTIDGAMQRHDAQDRPDADRRRVLVGGGLALAASLAGVAVLSRSTRYTTEIGEIRRVPLADGSTAAINTASRVTIDLGRTLRRIELAQGEAWFQVHKDAARPFQVEAGRVRVQAVGTAFSVRRLEGGAEVLVTEGVVDTWVEGAEGHRVRIAAGSAAHIGEDAAITSDGVSGSQLDRALAWRSGKIDLLSTPLADAVAEFNRYNVRKLVLTDPHLASEAVDGTFRTDDPAGFAVAVRTLLGTSLDTSDPDMIRLGPPA